MPLSWVTQFGTVDGLSGSSQLLAAKRAILEYVRVSFPDVADLPSEIREAQPLVARLEDQAEPGTARAALFVPPHVSNIIAKFRVRIRVAGAPLVSTRSPAAQRETGRDR